MQKARRKGPGYSVWGGEKAVGCTQKYRAKKFDSHWEQIHRITKKCHINKPIWFSLKICKFLGFNLYTNSVAPTKIILTKISELMTDLKRNFLCVTSEREKINKVHFKNEHVANT